MQSNFLLTTVLPTQRIIPTAAFTFCSLSCENDSNFHSPEFEIGAQLIVRKKWPHRLLIPYKTYTSSTIKRRKWRVTDHPIMPTENKVEVWLRSIQSRSNAQARQKKSYSSGVLPSCSSVIGIGNCFKGSLKNLVREHSDLWNVNLTLEHPKHPHCSYSNVCPPTTQPVCGSKPHTVLWDA